MPDSPRERYLAVHAVFDQYGAHRLRALLVALGEGADIAGAFEQALGVPLARFEADLVRQLTNG